MAQEQKNYMTPQGFRRLQDEFTYLTTIDRPETVKVVQWAASLGDRSENADYQYGKKRLREIDSRLRFLKKRLDNAEVVEPADGSGEKVKFGATVTIEDEEGEQKTYSIVGIDETDPKQGRVSWKSPIGHSLLGKELDDEVQVQTPNGKKEFTIVDVQYLPIEIPPFEKSENHS